jgi:hypothetical protein
VSSAPAAIRLRKDEYRWSSACKCPRKAVYEKRGAPARERSERENRILHRGKLFGRFVAEQFALKFGDDAVEFEREVSWPGGTLHTDVFVIPEKASFEVKSTTSPASALEDAIIQNAGEQHFDPECEMGGVILVDPVDLDEVVRPVVLNPDLIAHVEGIAEQVVSAEANGTLPDRVCSKPADAMGKLCPFAEKCFSDEPAWAPTPAIEIEGDVARLATELYLVQRRRKSTEGQAGTLKDEERLLQDELRELLEPNIEHVAPGLKVKRTVSSKTTFNGISAGIEAGHLDPDLLAPYRKTSETDTIKVSATGDGPPVPLAAEVLDEDVPF